MNETAAMAFPGWFVRLMGVVMTIASIVVSVVVPAAVSWAYTVDTRLVRIEEKVSSAYQMQAIAIDGLSARVGRNEVRMDRIEQRQNDQHAGSGS